jgi:hypothetical protein
MLWEEMERYTKLTGEDATHVPIMKLGAYLDGYEKGIEVLDKIRAEIENDWQLKKYPSSPFSCGLRRAIEIIDKYKAESEE